MKVLQKIFIACFVVFLCAEPGLCLKKHKMASPVQGKISSPFGTRRDPFTNAWAFHTGLDIAAPSKTPIYAIQDGIVVFSDWKGGYGNCIIIEHEYPDIPQLPKILTKYGHNYQNLVRKGDYVKRGDLIGYVGSSGRSTGPHLHFEVIYQGSVINPMEYIKKLPAYLDYAAYVREKRSYTSYNKID